MPLQKYMVCYNDTFLFSLKRIFFTKMPSKAAAKVLLCLCPTKYI